MSAIAEVLRVEHRERGTGPWCEHFVSGINGEPPSPDYDYPLTTDIVDEFKDSCRNLHGERTARHAFASREALERWFNEYDREMLRKAGFRLIAYAVPQDRVIRGTWQVLFDALAAQPLGEREL